jgi:hypothetical protein
MRGRNFLKMKFNTFDGGDGAVGSGHVNTAAFRPDGTRTATASNESEGSHFKRERGEPSGWRCQAVGKGAVRLAVDSVGGRRTGLETRRSDTFSVFERARWLASTSRMLFKAQTSLEPERRSGGKGDA